MNKEAILESKSWIVSLQNGDKEGANHLWQRYYGKMINIAQKRLSGSPQRLADGEDVVVSAFHSFFRALDEDRLPRIDDEDEIWRLLVT